MAHLNPTPQEVAGKVPDLRKRFQEKLKDKIAQYDKRDVERLLTEDAYARCFLRSLKSKGDVDKAVDIIDQTFKFRKEIGIWDLTDDVFPDRIKEHKDSIYMKNRDKDGYPIMYMDCKANTAKGSEENAWLKKFVAYKFDQHHRANCEQMVVLLLDMSGVSIGNLGGDIMKYIITSLSIYFPAICAYCINYDMPTLVSAAWKLVSAFLSEDQSKKLIMVNKKDIKKYIPEDQLWPHMLK